MTDTNDQTISILTSVIERGAREADRFSLSLWDQNVTAAIDRILNTILNAVEVRSALTLIEPWEEPEPTVETPED